jgi:hypothetical protein
MGRCADGKAVRLAGAPIEGMQMDNYGQIDSTKMDR